jgi:hypothetical protein
VTALVSGCNAAPAGTELSSLAGVLFINEFMASNNSTLPDEHGDYADWIELHNAGDKPVRLQGVYLTDNLASPMKWTFPDMTIPAGGFLLIWADAEYRQGPLHASFRLDADQGEELGLFTAQGDRVFIVDTLSFCHQTSDTSYGRVPDGGKWQFMSVPTPGEPNTSGISSLAGIVFINEFLASNQSINTDEAGDYDDWVELYNAADTAVTLRGFALTDDLRQPTRWSLPDVTIPPRGYLLVWADGEEEEGAYHASFNLAAAQGEQLGLFQKYGTHALMVDTLSFGAQKPDTSFGRLPDGSADWQFMQPSPARTNRGTE